MKVIAVANQKGGVGKTTVTRELSACCALRGYQTLVIDCDPQANLSASWVDPDIYNITLSHVLIEPDAQAGIKLEPRALDDAIVDHLNRPSAGSRALQGSIRFWTGYRM